MEKLKCKACGCYSMLPVEVTVEEEGTTFEGEHESHFYSCHVCGDNWLSVKEPGDAGRARVTFIHQMGIEPVLKRTAVLDTETAQPREEAASLWEYYLGDETVDSAAWKEKLVSRRKVLKSICSN